MGRNTAGGVDALPLPRRGRDPLFPDLAALAGLPPTWAACSPLCARVLPTGLIGLHRDTCARFARYIDGALAGRWASWG